MSGYYINSLHAMRNRLQKEHRLLMARYGRMERMGHPDLRDQGRAIDLHKKFLEMVKDEMEAVAIHDARPLKERPSHE